MIEGLKYALPKPDAGWRLLLFMLIIMFALFSSIITLCFPAFAKIIIVIIILLGILVIIRLSFLQLLLLITVIPSILPSFYVKISNIAFTLILITAVFWIIFSSDRYKYRWYRNSKLEIISSLYLFFAISMLLSSLYNSTSVVLCVFEIIRYIFYGGLILVSYYLMKDIKDIKKVLWTGLVVAVVIAFYSYKTAIDMGVGNAIMRYGIGIMRQSVSVFVNSNSIATLITFPMPLLISYIMYSNDKTRIKYCWIAFLFLAIPWFSLNSRANYLYLFTVYCILAIFHPKRNMHILVILSVILVITGIIVFNLFPILSMLLRLESGVTYRDSLWKAAIKMIQESPLLGKGPGYFEQYKFYYMDPEAGRAIVGNWQGVATHSFLIQRGVEMGLPAIIVQVFIWLYPIISFVKNAKYVESSNYKYLYLAGGAMWIGLICRSIMDTGGSVVGLLLLPLIFRIPELVHNKDD